MEGQEPMGWPEAMVYVAQLVAVVIVAWVLFR